MCLQLAYYSFVMRISARFKMPFKQLTLMRKTDITQLWIIVSLMPYFGSDSYTNCSWWEKSREKNAEQSELVRHLASLLVI